MPFYEYYFEPAGKNGMVAFQFMHEDYKLGMKAKKSYRKFNKFSTIYIYNSIHIKFTHI